MRGSGSICRDGNGAGRIRGNNSNHGEPSGQMDRKGHRIVASPEPPDLVYYPNAHKEDDHILFRNGDRAGLEGGEADGEKRASSCAVLFLFVLVLLGSPAQYHSSLVRQMSALGEVKEQAYISRGTPAPSRQPKKSSFAPSWAIY